MFAPVPEASAVTFESKIVKKLSREDPLSVPPVPIAAPVDVVDATTTLSLTVMFSTTERPEATRPPPRAAPLEESSPLPVGDAIAVTFPPRIINVPRNVSFADTAGPAPMPVPPVAVIEPFTISSNSHLPFAAVPIPAPLSPAWTVSEPPAPEESVTFDSSAHSIPVEYDPVFVSEFAPSNTTATELSEIKNGYAPVRTTFDRVTEIDAPCTNIWLESEVPQIRKFDICNSSESGPLHLRRPSATEIDPWAASHSADMRSQVDRASFAYEFAIKRSVPDICE
jgi:hypothetical protein